LAIYSQGHGIALSQKKFQNISFSGPGMNLKQKTLHTAPSNAAIQPPLPVGSGHCGVVFGVCVFLAGAIWVVYGQTLGHEFVNYDDGVYIADNPAVLGGLSLKGIVWAFTHNVNVNWTPLTVISHMLDCQFYGLHAGGHHLTNLLLHAATAILLFLVLRQLTAALWSSAFVAAVFAVHPLHVESVAWIAERRDVLSGLFFMLTPVGLLAVKSIHSTGRAFDSLASDR
jgi:hypothetical protein